ncbi:MAG: cyclic nucleotide-binding domain-containing protein [Caldilineaceae bacterium]|nr:cyclic nucleotide-binding domain-containing protein [Caldilineaceae bacterium]
MATLEPIIAGHPFFQGFAPEHLALLVSCASNVRFAAGATIFKEAEEANRFYLIREGQVTLAVYVPGRGPLTIQTLGAGEVLGWSWLFLPYRWHFDAYADESTRAIAFDGQCLRQKCEEDHDLGYAFMQRFAQMIMQRLQATRLQLLDLYGVERTPLYG